MIDLAAQVANLQAPSRVSTGTANTPIPDAASSSDSLSSDNEPVLRKRDPSKSLSSVDEQGSRKSESQSCETNIRLTSQYEEPVQKRTRSTKDKSKPTSSLGGPLVAESSTAPKNARDTRSRVKSMAPASSDQVKYIAG